MHMNVRKKECRTCGAPRKAEPQKIGNKRVAHKTEQHKGHKQRTVGGISSSPRQTRSKRRFQTQRGHTRQTQHDKTTATHCPRVLQVPLRNRPLSKESNFVGHQEIRINELPGRYHGSQLQSRGIDKAQDGTGAGAAGSTAATAEKHLRTKGQGSQVALA